MREISVKCPAKINLTLEVLDKRPDGFHNIQSIMQAINLFDILTIRLEKSEKFEITLSGTSDEIPYDERNLVYKAAKEFFRCKDAKMQRCKEPELCLYASMPLCVYIHIEKNIPIAAGLAGGSTDAAGALWGLNELLGQPFSKKELHNLCAKLGSDLNFCLEGGCQLATGRGEILEGVNVGVEVNVGVGVNGVKKAGGIPEFRLALIKPKGLGISAKEAYTKFSALKEKPGLNVTQKFIQNPAKNIKEFLHNDLEIALLADYPQLKEIKRAYPNAVMSGSGSTFFVIEEEIKPISSDFWVKTDLKSISYGVCKN